MRSSTRTTRLDCTHTYVHLLSHPCLTYTYYHTFAPCHIIVPPRASSCLIMLPLSLPLMCQVAMQECQSDFHPSSLAPPPHSPDAPVTAEHSSATVQPDASPRLDGHEVLDPDNEVRLHTHLRTPTVTPLPYLHLLSHLCPMPHHCATWCLFMPHPAPSLPPSYVPGRNAGMPK